MPDNEIDDLKAKAHETELKILRLETNNKWAVYCVAAVIAFFGLANFTGISVILNNARSIVQTEAVEAGAAEIKRLVEEATDDRDTIRASLSEVCADDRFLEKTGQCIFHSNPGRYALNYGSALAHCASKGARLCTRAEVVSAQKKGAEWCSYGWVSDTVRGDSNFDTRGSILYPTQRVEEGCGQLIGIVEIGNVSVRDRLAGANCCM
jgi:hypothetical protein